MCLQWPQQLSHRGVRVWRPAQSQPGLQDGSVRSVKSSQLNILSLYCSLCDSSLPGGYEKITCSNPSEIVYVNLAMMTWECNVDDGRCPGAFHVGCQSDLTTSTTTTTTKTTSSTTPAPPGVCPDGWIDSMEGCFLFQYKGELSWGSWGISLQVWSVMIALFPNSKNSQQCKALLWKDDTSSIDCKNI